MTDIHSLLTWVFFEAEPGGQAEPTERFQYFFDTDTAYTWLVGISDYLKGKPDADEAQRWFYRPSLLISSLLVDAEFNVDLLAPHRWELAQLMGRRGRSDHITAVRLLSKHLEGRLPDEIEISDVDGCVTIAFTLLARAHGSRSIESFCKLATLSRVDARKQMESMVAFFRASKRDSSDRKSVEHIISDPLYRYCYDRYLFHARGGGDRSRAIDCAAVVALADHVETYNKSPGGKRAPMFICGEEQTIFNVLCDVLTVDDFAARLLLKPRSGSVEAFAFQTPMLLALDLASLASEHESGREDDKERTFERYRQRPDLQAYRALVSSPVTFSPGRPGSRDVNAEARQKWNELTRAEWDGFWLAWLTNRYDSADVQHAVTQLVLRVDYDEEVLAEKMAGVRSAIARATQSGKSFVTLFGWRKEVGNVVEFLSSIYGRCPGDEDLMLLLRLYDLAFGRGTLSGLESHLRQMVKRSETFEDGIQRFVEEAWAQFQASHHRNSKSAALFDSELIQEMVILLWIAESHESRSAESRSIAELIEEVSATFSQTDEQQPWFLAMRSKLAKYNFDAQTDLGLKSELLLTMDGLARTLVDVWKTSASLEERLRSGFPAAYALFNVGICQSQIDKLEIGDSRKSWPLDRLFSACDTIQFAESTKILRALRSDWESGRGANEVVDCLIENQLLFFLASGGTQFSEEEVSEMHLLAGSLRRRRRSGIGWTWHFDDTLTVYYCRVAVLMHDRGVRSQERAWLKRAKGSIIEALGLLAGDARLEDRLDAIDEALSLLALRNSASVDPEDSI